MNIVIFAGGDQKRLELSAKKNPKVLFKINSHETVLSHKIKQLYSPLITKIIIYVGDKNKVINYINVLKKDHPIPIVTRKKYYPDLGTYVTKYKNKEAVTFIFGDMYFPHRELSKYIEFIHRKSNEFDAVIGISKTHAGDYVVTTKDTLVTSISKQNKIGNYTCGVFTLINPEIIPTLKSRKKITEIFSQISLKGFSVGYFIFKNPIDIDTPEELKTFKNQIKKHEK